jgi:hypothetical protein
MQSKNEIAYRKLLSFYAGLVTLTGLAALLLAFTPNTQPCSQLWSAKATAPVAYVCWPEDVTYILQVMAYALVLSLGCLLLVVLMQRASQRHAH